MLTSKFLLFSGISILILLFLAIVMGKLLVIAALVVYFFSVVFNSI